MLQDARQWLNSGRIEDTRQARSGATALHVAAAKGYSEVLRCGVCVSGESGAGWRGWRGSGVVSHARSSVSFSAVVRLAVFTAGSPPAAARWFLADLRGQGPRLTPAASSVTRSAGHTGHVVLWTHVVWGLIG